MRKFMIAAASLLAAAAWAGERPFDIAGAAPEQFRIMQNASVEREAGKLILTIPEDRSARYPGVALRAKGGGPFDASGCSVLAFDVKNLRPVMSAGLACELLNFAPDGKAFKYRVKGGIALRPFEKGVMRVPFYRNFGAGEGVGPEGMAVNFEGFPHSLRFTSQRIDHDAIDEIRLFLKDWCGEEQRFEISNIRLESPVRPLPAALASKETFYPCIDRFGQYKHKEWPRKVSDDRELRERLRTEEAELAAKPGIPDRTVYGGWASGPSFEATGHFYPRKHGGKWYLVDPSGKLFWSLGIDGVRITAGTGISLREHYFEELPQDGDPLYGQCFGRHRGGRRGYYREKLGDAPIRTFEFHMRNLISKLGPDFRAKFPERAHRRLKSWGINTIGNWSQSDVMRKGGIPYVADIQAVRPKMNSGKGFYDVYDPRYRASIEQRLRERHAYSLDDPFCIGFFIDNELNWGTDRSFAEDALRSAASQPAKQQFFRRLKAKYGGVGKLNRAWKTAFASWDAAVESTELPDTADARKDLRTFSHALTEHYFRVNREAVRAVAPHKLYLGCRFHDFPAPAIRAAAKHVDVLSFNLYKYSVAEFFLPDGVDKPAVIGEFHFGTTAGGVPGAALSPVAGEEDQARAYVRYIESALYNPYFVGAHFFLYCDQAATGRPSEGENLQTGFVDVTDTPYPKLVEAAREVSADLYRCRMEMGTAFTSPDPSR